MLTLLDEDSMVTMTIKSKQVIDLLEGCEILLSSVSTAVKEKATYEKRFFNASSLALGAVCAGMSLFLMHLQEQIREIS
jgi:hypothetical protein